jgi:hypothetical protein
MLQNKNEQLKLNIQLFAGEDEQLEEKKDEQPQLDLTGFVKKEDLDSFGAGIIESLKALIPQAKVEEPKEELKQDDEDIPQLIKVLMEEQKRLKAELDAQKNVGFVKKRDTLKEKFGLEDSDLADVLDEKSLMILEKSLEKFKTKHEAKTQEIVKEEMKKQGVNLSLLNEINKKDEAKKNVMKKGLDFFKITK